MFLLDTDFLYAYFFETQSTHNRALKLITLIQTDTCYILNINMHELATVISNKESQELAIFVINKLNDLDLVIIRLSDVEESKVWELFKSQTKNKISFIDCANLYIARNRSFKVVSFDNFYPKEILLTQT